ncbi:Ig-like domain repeat protein [Cellulomonas humilata]|uniref:Ig-like domain repeat protein n=1 Tax=Cellulomonas humilata TaxID=144055 RepID=A0A7Y5ZYW4_9CELL|nr:Ig-like domain-containing protein [Cellulomonas humilata]NUU16550.1 Ig-like domain repeat protein [Cellulomonas humilata]
MRLNRLVAGALAATVATGAVLVAVAGPASANDEGPLIPGSIFFFANTGGFDGNTPADQITSGTTAVRPWQSLTVDATCPAGTGVIQPLIRIPQAGVPVIDWEQVPFGPVSTLVDSDGRPYTGRGDFMGKPQALTYLASQPGNTAVLPFLVACRDVDGNSIAYFETGLTMTGTSTANLTWSIPAAAFPSEPSTTVLGVSATTVEAGTSVDLTATVDPAAATGDVEFFAGTTSLGTATVTGGVATLSTAGLPVGTNAVTARYLGGSHATSTSASVSVVVTAVAARTTVTTLGVTPVSGAAYSAVTFSTTVVASSGAANGTVSFKDGTTVLGSLPVVGGVVADFTTNVLGAGAHSLTADFVGTAPYSGSVSAPVAATYELSGAVDEQTVTVDIPVGAISITTPYTPSNPLALGTAVLDPADSTYSASAAFEDIVITDTRAGNLGFTASVVSGPFTSAAGSFSGLHAGLTGLVADQVAGNALQAGNVTLTNHAPASDGLDVPKVFATYGAGQPLGTAHIEGVFGVDQVPTSVAPGLYTATVTFTAV